MKKWPWLIVLPFFQYCSSPGLHYTIANTHSLTRVISGNRPDPSLYASYLPYIAFDGILLHEYTPAALSRIAMMSDDLQTYTHWDGTGGIPAAERRRIVAAIAWAQLMQLRVDFINTDHIQQLAEYLSAQ
jgi:alkaline phosphatase